ncbi:MAG: ABA4-like family protein [Pseudomonadota bacterium]
MPTPDVIFAVGNQTALIGWAILILAPRRYGPILWVPGLLIPFLLGLAYAALILLNFTAAGGDFGSIEGVRTLMQNDAALTAGWLHYLAFDLFVGAWIARNADENRIPRLIQAVMLLATFMFGPIGLVLYLVTRTAMGAPLRGEEPAS